MNTCNSRESYLDWLRVLAIAGVLFYHSARPFIPEDPWHISDTTKSDVLNEFNFWLSRFRMPLLFFVSGAVTWLMMRKRTAGAFVRLRFQRLFIPLLAGMFIVVPPQVYAERVTQGYTGSYGEFYLSVFNFKPYPAGNFSWHHLWFIAYLFVFDVVLAPLFAWCKTDSAKRFIRSLTFLAGGKRVYWLMLPSVLMYSLMVLDHPGTNDLFHDQLFFFYWLFFLLAGFLCMLQPALMESLVRNRRFSLRMAILLFLLITALRWTDFEWFSYQPKKDHWSTFVYLARFPLNAWFWLFALAGYGKQYLAKLRPVPSYINESVYPFYILHQTVIVVIAYFVVRSQDPVGMKYWFIVIMTLCISYSVFHLFIRPYRLMRLLFGMKLKGKDPDPAPPVPGDPVMPVITSGVTTNRQ